MAVAWTSGQAQAQQAAAEPNGGDIVVTARFREERLQDVPVAVTAVSGDRLQSAGISELVQLQFESPSLNISIANPRMTNIGIRGLGNNPAADGLSASVGIYLDGVYLDRPGMGTFDLVDVERIEVLRGPQGTLFGKNTTAGALSVTTKKPGFEPELIAQASTGSLSLRQLQASGTGPITDSLAVRVSGYVTRREGYLKNVLLGGSELSREREGVRAQVLFKPSESVSWRLIGEYAHEDGSASSFVLYDRGPSSSANPAFVPYNLWASRLGITPIDDPYSLRTNQNKHQRQVQKSYGVTSILDVGLGDFTLTSVTGYRDWKFTPYNDLDWSPADVIREQGVVNHQKQFSQELRVASATDGPIEFVAGLYYFHRRLEADSFRTYGSHYSRGLGSGAALDNGTTHTCADPTIDSFAAFGQGTWHISPQLDFTAGIRESYEKARETVTRIPFVGGRGTPPASVAPYTGSLKVSDWSPSVLGTLSYRPTRDLLAYATFSHGGKAGGFNTSVPTNGDMGSLAVDPEKATNYELGLKTEWFDRKVTLNLSAFLTDVSGYQANATFPDATGVLITQITNAGKVRAKGVELEASVRPIDGLRLGGSAAYNDTRYRSFVNASPVQGSTARTQDLSGRPVNNAPRWHLNFNGEYSRELADNLVGYLGADVSHKSGYFGNIDDSDYSWVKGYTITNFRAGVKIDEGRYDLSVWLRNAFDERYFFSVINASTGSGGYFASPSEPRTYGLTVSVRL